MAGPLNVAFGAEYRKESYQIVTGDLASYSFSGAASFAGYAPNNATDRERKNYAGYVDLAGTPIDALRVDLAGRYEHYSDFGNATVGKLGVPVPAAQNITAALIASGLTLDPSVVATGSTGINLFANGINTRTKGADFVLNSAQNYFWGHVDWSIEATWNETTITKVIASPAQLGGQPLFDATAFSDLTTASPKLVVNLGMAWTMNAFSVTVHEIIYGPSSKWQSDVGDNPTVLPIYYNNRIGTIPITNLELGMEVLKGLKLTLGANNLFHRYPEKLDGTLSEHFFSHDDNAGVQKYPGFSAIERPVEGLQSSLRLGMLSAFSRRLLRQDYLDLHQHARRRKAGHLHRRARRQIRLLGGAEVLRIGLHESLKVHAPILVGRVGDQEHQHLDHIGEAQAHLIERSLEIAEGTQGLRRGVAPVRGGALRRFRVLGRWRHAAVEDQGRARGDFHRARDRKLTAAQ
jgi:hypothetical protein